MSYLVALLLVLLLHTSLLWCKIAFGCALLCYADWYVLFQTGIGRLWYLGWNTQSFWQYWFLIFMLADRSFTPLLISFVAYWRSCLPPTPSESMSSGSILDANVEWRNVLPDSIPPHPPPAHINAIIPEGFPVDFDVKHITSLAMLSASIYAGCRIIFLCVSASLGFDGHVSHHYHWRTRAVGLFGTGVEWSNVIPGSTPPRPPPPHIIALMQDCFWVCTALLRWLVCFVPNRNWQIVVFGMKHTKFLTILISHFHAGWRIIHSLAYQLCSILKVMCPTNPIGEYEQWVHFGRECGMKQRLTW